jgi:hypothetical protein
MKQAIFPNGVLLRSETLIGLRAIPHWHPFTHVHSGALSRQQARRLDVVEGVPSHPSPVARMHSQNACQSPSASGRRSLVLPRTGRRCIGRGRLDGHSDRECGNNSCESRFIDGVGVQENARVTRSTVTCPRELGRQDGHRHRVSGQDVIARVCASIMVAPWEYQGGYLS